jgi:hypothetical protein
VRSLIEITFLIHVYVIILLKLTWCNYCIHSTYYPIDLTNLEPMDSKPTGQADNRGFVSTTLARIQIVGLVRPLLVSKLTRS